VDFLYYMIGVILFGTLTDYNPEDIVEINVQNTIEESVPTEITIFDWNIGYAGLGKDEDFFMDGGEKAVPAKEHVEKYLKDISTIIKQTITFYLFLFHLQNLWVKWMLDLQQYQDLKYPKQNA